jgi:hypothetical protein
MATETQAASSPVEATDPFNGQSPTLHEFNSYRATGEVPARFAPAEDADPEPADETPAEGEEPETAPETAPEDDQEPPEGIGNKARRRFEKLLAENKALKAAQQAKPDVTPVPSPAPQAAQVAPTSPEPTVNDTKDDGTLKYADYADFVKALGRWSAEQTLHEAHQREVQQRQVSQVQENVEDARKRYGTEFDSVIEPTAATIMGDKTIPMQVKQMLSESDVLPELIYTIGTDQKTMKELERLSRVNPSQAIRYIATLEAGIRLELAAEPNAAATPEPKKTAAPKPPSPVNGASSRAFDVSDESLSPDDWARKRNQQLASRR